MNRLFTAWVEQVYHRRPHSETDVAPLARWSAGGPFPLPSTDALAEAFLWAEQRTVSKTALVSLQGNSYQVDPALAGRRVELVFDPFDLTRIEVRLAGTPVGAALPHRITRHAHVKARPETPPAAPAARPGSTTRACSTTLTTPSSLNASTTRPSPAPTLQPAPPRPRQLPGQLDPLTDGGTDS